MSWWSFDHQGTKAQKKCNRTLTKAMKTIITVLLALTVFGSFAQNDTVTFLHKGYSFQSSTKTMLSHFNLDKDSIGFYEKGLQEILNNKNTFSSDSVLQFGTLRLDFDAIIRQYDFNQSEVKVKRLSDGKWISPKVIYDKQIFRNQGQGGSSVTYIILRDKKKKVEIVRTEIWRSISC